MRARARAVVVALPGVFENDNALDTTTTVRKDVAVLTRSHAADGAYVAEVSLHGLAQREEGEAGALGLAREGGQRGGRVAGCGGRGHARRADGQQQPVGVDELLSLVRVVD